MLLGFLYFLLHSSHLHGELLQKLKFFATIPLRKAQSKLTVCGDKSTQHYESLIIKSRTCETCEHETIYT